MMRKDETLKVRMMLLVCQIADNFFNFRISVRPGSLGIPSIASVVPNVGLELRKTAAATTWCVRSASSTSVGSVWRNLTRAMPPITTSVKAAAECDSDHTEQVYFTDV